ncbi:TPA: type III secretion system gatekeeper subunit SctW [Morganella morganii]|nr:type III secretion system gatekeeper subunit SctW [Morganella morganii]
MINSLPVAAAFRPSAAPQKQAGDVAAEQRPAENQTENHAEQMMDVMDDMAMALSQFNRKQYGKEDYISQLPASEQKSSTEGAETKLDRVVKWFAACGRSVREFLDYVRNLFPDPSDYVMALRSLLRKLPFSAEEAAEIDAEIEQLLYGEFAQETRAGINIALKIRLHAPVTQLDCAQLRMVYRSYISWKFDILYLWKVWLEQYRKSRVRSLLNYVRDSLVCDMAAVLPSCSHHSEFGELTTRLHTLNQLISLNDMFHQKISSLNCTEPVLADEPRLNQLLISGLGDAEAFQSETESLLAAAEDDKNRPLILQRLIMIFGEIPDVLFLQEAGKEQVVSFLKALMSRTINIL